MSASSAKARLRARQLTAASIWVLILGALVYLLYLAATGTAVVPRKVTPDVAQVHLEHVLPPPPPPPPPKQKFVEQPKDKTQAAKTPEQPAPRPQQAPAPPGPKAPASAPALAAQGQGPADSFGLTGGDPNGRDYVGGGGGGGGGSAFGDYAAMLELRVREQLSKDRRLRGVHYRVYIEVWITPDGHVQRSQYIGGSGKSEVDRDIQESLRNMARLTQPLPEAMPQPIVMHLTSTQ